MVQPASKRLVTEATIQDPASAPGAYLNSTFAPSNTAERSMKMGEVAQGKLGDIGTSGKGVVSFRIDHQTDTFIANHLPLFKARGLPFSFGIVAGSMENPTAAYEPTTTTWTGFKEQVMNYGGEVWCHSMTHGDGVSLQDEIVNSKALIESHGIKVMGWQQPGLPSTYSTGGWTSFSEFESNDAGVMIRRNYPLFEGDVAGTVRRSIPTRGAFGHGHYTLDTSTLAAAKAVVDEAVYFGVGVQFMYHPNAIGQPGQMSLADFTAFLDYVVSQWDAGKVEVLTASGLAFADPGSTHRTSLLPQSGFEGFADGTLATAIGFSGGDGVVKTDGGRTGSNYLRCTSGVTFRGIPMDQYGAVGNALMFEGWYRSAVTATARFQVIYYNGTSNVVIRNETRACTTSWQRIRAPFVVPVGAQSVTPSFGVQSGGPVDWDDVRVVAV